MGRCGLVHVYIVYIFFLASKIRRSFSCNGICKKIIIFLRGNNDAHTSNVNNWELILQFLPSTISYVIFWKLDDWRYYRSLDVFFFLIYIYRFITNQRLSSETNRRRRFKFFARVIYYRKQEEKYYENSMICQLLVARWQNFGLI